MNAIQQKNILELYKNACKKHKNAKSHFNWFSYFNSEKIQKLYYKRPSSINVCEFNKSNNLNMQSECYLSLPLPETLIETNLNIVTFYAERREWLSDSMTSAVYGTWSISYIQFTGYYHNECRIYRKFIRSQNRRLLTV